MTLRAILAPISLVAGRGSASGGHRRVAAALLVLLSLLLGSQAVVSVAGAADQPKVLRFDELYSGGGVRGMIFSETLKSLSGKQVTMVGFMAPPLKPSIRFFVLTRKPMAFCPFCSTDADWPTDIVLVLVKKDAKALPNDLNIKVTGRLEIGSHTDPETGFVSQVRIYADKVEPVK